MKKLLFLSLLTLACASDYSKVIKATEDDYYNRNYDSAIPRIRALYEDAAGKDKLLFLMEAGMIFHSKGDYETSNKVFKEAEGIAENIKVSLTKSGLSFLLSDNESNYVGEDFERVMIKFYIAYNYLVLGDLENAKIYFRRLDFDLKEMKFMAANYRQNNAARLLDAYVSERLGRYNDARVQYRNMEQLIGQSSLLAGDRYFLALKEGDDRDKQKYSQGESKIQAYDRSMRAVSPTTNNLTEVVIIHEAGKSAIKMSRGKLINDEYLSVALRGAIEATMRNGGSISASASAGGRGMSVPRGSGGGAALAAVISALAIAENPIPIYKERDPAGSKPKKYYVNGVDIGSAEIMNDYSDTAIHNFNDNYQAIITKNLSSLAVKMVAAAIASEALSKAIEGSRGNKKGDDLVSGLISLAAGAAAGITIAQTIAPDLRCWRTIPSTFQIKRIFLAPGEYNFKVDLAGGGVHNAPSKIMVEEGKPLFIPIRSYTN